MTQAIDHELIEAVYLSLHSQGITSAEKIADKFEINVDETVNALEQLCESGHAKKQGNGTNYEIIHTPWIDAVLAYRKGRD